MTACAVIVPTHDRPELLERCLAALANQTTPRGGYEVIVADDAALETTRAQVVRWAEEGLPVRYVRMSGPSHGPAAARNAGWRSTDAWLLAFTDDDTVADPEWLLRARDAFDGDQPDHERWLDAAWGRIVVPLPADPTDYERDAAGLEDAGFVTANCFVRRDVLEALGGFDERFTAAWREDSDLYFRLLAAHRRVAWLRQAVVVHPVRPAHWGVSVQQQRKAVFDALLYRKHPRLFTRLVRPARPTLYYPIVTALVVAVIGVGARVPSLALGGWTAWAALTGLFVARRLRGTSCSPRHVAEMVVTSAVIPPLSLFWRLRGAVRHRVLFW